MRKSIRYFELIKLLSKPESERVMPFIFYILNHNKELTSLQLVASQRILEERREKMLQYHCDWLGINESHI